MSGQYILDRQTPVPCNELMKWGAWLQNSKRLVGGKTKRGVRVSTVFLGLDHQYGEGDPLLFETMIFGGELDKDCVRYSTMNQAREGHRVAVKLARRVTQCKKKKK